MTNSVDSDEMVCYEPSHLNLHCLHSYSFLSTELKGLTLSMLGKIFSKLHFDNTKTYLYDLDPVKPHIYIVKLGFTCVGVGGGVYIIFLISAQHIACWYSLEPPWQIYVLSRNMKNI